ncbi:Probable lipoprotein signal peptide [hydrothermal vent metagenome]|uniref:Probable lipoprotein signal peptide n=1 Tax=hydrothermal vent metagenome TaxID=652676 RepID=A0A3B0VMI7_9ZZZZ
MPFLSNNTVKIFALLLCAGVLVFWYLSNSSPNRKTPVGRSYKLFYDDNRVSWINNDKRPLATTIWYPAIVTAPEQPWKVGIFKAGWNAKDAKLSTQQAKYPLIILSHGTASAAMQLSWLAETLASNGYIVAAVNHHGNTAAENDLLPQGFMLWWERAMDVSVLIDKLLSDQQFGRHIDTTKIGAAGFSLGGYTAIAIAGGITNRTQWQKFCQLTATATICKPPPESDFSLATFAQLITDNQQVQDSINLSANSFVDNRVKAIYAIAPVHGPAFTQSSLTNIKIPTKIVVGTGDNQAQPQYNAKILADSIPNAQLQLLGNVSHYTFLANCTLKGKWFVAEICKDNSGIDRTKVHQQVSWDALEFFNKQLL